MNEMYQKEEVIPYMKGLWREALQSICGLNDSYFTKRHGPCPHCFGKDRFRWTDNLKSPGDGGNICNQCGNDTGIGLMMKLTGEPYSEVINILGRFLGKVPQDYRIKANKRASRTSPYKMGAQIDNERCLEIMGRTEVVDSTPLSVFEGIYSDSGFSVGRKPSGELIHAAPCFMAYSDGLSDEMCNVMFINEEGDVSYAAKDYTRQSVSVIGSFKADEYAYLVDNYVDGVRVHLATGNRCVLVCYSSYNMEMVAYALKDFKLRIACRLDRELLCVADDRGIDVVIPNDEYSFKTGIRKRIYKASDLLNS